MPAPSSSGLFGQSCVWHANMLFKTMNIQAMWMGHIEGFDRFQYQTKSVEVLQTRIGFSSIVGWKSKVKDASEIQIMCETDPSAVRIRRCDVLQCPRGSQLRSIGAEVVKIYSRRALTRAVTALSLSQHSWQLLWQSTVIRLLQYLNPCDSIPIIATGLRKDQINVYRDFDEKRKDNGKEIDNENKTKLVK